MSIFPNDSYFDNKKIGIFTNDFDKASIFFDILYKENMSNVKRYVKSRTITQLILKDGTDYRWIYPYYNSKGHRCSKAYIDKNMSEEEFKNIVVPTCYMCSQENVILF